MARAVSTVRIWSHYHRRWLLLGSALLFAAVAILGWTRLPADQGLQHPWLLVLLVVAGTPALILALAFEYRQLASLLGAQAPWGESVRISVYGSLANLLPLPGAVLVRATALRSAGVPPRMIGTGFGVLGLTFIACTTLLFAGVLLIRGSLIAIAVFGTGLVVMTSAVALSRRVTPSPGHLGVVRIAVAELVVLIVTAGRLGIALLILGASSGVFEAVVLSVAVAATAAIAIVPGGLGVREGLSGIIGPLAGISVASAVVASALDRVVFLGGLAVVAGVLAIRGSTSGRRASPELGSEDLP